MTPVLDYDRLVADYTANLIETLRGFGPAAEFLALWVPDEAPLRSLASMLDAARAGGCPVLDITIGAATAAALDRDALAVLAAGFGIAGITGREDGGLNLSVRFGQAAAAPAAAAGPEAPLARARRAAAAETLATVPRPEIPAAYAAAITAAAAVPAGTPPATPPSGRAADSGITLSLWLDGDGVIQQAAVEGVAEPGRRGVLTALCRVVRGLPAQEAADHGVIRLERALRDFELPAPLPGVVTPPAISPLFALAERLLRGAIADWRAATGMPAGGNSFDEGPGPGWRALDDAGRRARLLEACGDGVDIVAIEYDVRILVRLHDAAGDAQRRLMALERQVKRLVDPRLELFFEPAGDANRLRRLSGAV